MRLLILGTVMDRTQAGGNQALISFANGLVKHPSVEPVVYVYSYDRELLDPSIPVILGTPPRMPGFLWRFPSLGFVSQLRDDLRRSQVPEVDVAFSVSLHLAAAYKKLRPDAPLITYFGPVISAREVMEEFQTSYWARRIEAALIDRIEKRVYKQPRSTHIAQTRLVAETREQHFGLPRGFFKVCPSGVNDSLFSRSNVQTDVRAKLNIPPGAFVVVTVARLVPWKRVDMAIDAMEGMDGDTWLLVVGGGADRESLEARAAKSAARDRIVFAGRAPSLVDWLAAADVFVLMSRIESFGLVYAEAMMLGLPCIGSTHDPPSVISSAADVIPEGEAGFCVNSVETLRDRLRLLRNNPELRSRMGRAAQELARRHYTVESFIQCIEREAAALLT